MKGQKLKGNKMQGRKLREDNKKGNMTQRCNMRKEEMNSNKSKNGLRSRTASERAAT